MTNRGILLSSMLLLCLLGACATNPITGRDQFVLGVSEETAIARSAQAYQAEMGELGKKGRISTDEKLNARVHLITDRLIDQAVSYRPETRNWAWSVKIIDEPKTANAFCMAGGKMAVYTGLIEKIKPSDDELAAVIGHEISHALLQHSREQMAEKQATGIGVALLGVAVGASPDQPGIRSLVDLGLLLPHSRRDEDEADRLGIELAAKAGYNPHAAVTLWEKMLKENSNNSKFDWLSTHPASPKRVEALQALEPEMAVYYRQARKTAPPSRAWTTTPANERVIDVQTGSKNK